MEALGVIGFVLALVAIGQIEVLKKNVTKLQAELAESRGQAASGEAQASD